MGQDVTYNNEPGIYRITITSPDPGEVYWSYIGSTRSTVRKRFMAHLNLLKRRKHGNYRLQNLYDTYGMAAFSIETLEVSYMGQLWKLEQGWLNKELHSRKESCVNILKKAGQIPRRGRMRRSRKEAM